jgi:gas vesicle protein
MSRTKLVITLAGVTLVAAAAGWTLGMLSAPASGKELRRRLARRAEEELKGISRAGRAFLACGAARAKEELERRQARGRDITAA